MRREQKTSGASIVLCSSSLRPSPASLANGGREAGKKENREGKKKDKGCAGQPRKISVEMLYS